MNLNDIRDFDLISVIGPTACGKTRKAVEIARLIGGEIISGDSRQVYRGMTIGTGKDLDEYGEIPVHLIDIRQAGEKYNLYQFLSDFHNAVAEIRLRGSFPILCGGTGMYIEAALNGLRLPEVPANLSLREGLKGYTLDELTEKLKSYKVLHNTTDVDNCQRAIRAIEIEEYYRTHPEASVNASKVSTKKPKSLIIGLDIDREMRRKRITERLYARLEEGMIEEVRNLIDSGVKPEDLIYYGLEYKFVTLYILGELSRDRMIHDLEIAIHQFAKRQMTWFRGMERRGHKINWFPFDMSAEEILSSLAMPGARSSQL